MSVVNYMLWIRWWLWLAMAMRDGNTAHNTTIDFTLLSIFTVLHGLMLSLLLTINPNFIFCNSCQRLLIHPKLHSLTFLSVPATASRKHWRGDNIWYFNLNRTVCLEQKANAYIPRTHFIISLSQFQNL